jgi:hypothetical protein
MEYTEEQYKRINLTRVQCEKIITEGHGIVLWEEHREVMGITVERSATPEQLEWHKHFNRCSRFDGKRYVISAYKLREWLRY